MIKLLAIVMFPVSYPISVEGRSFISVLLMEPGDKVDLEHIFDRFLCVNSVLKILEILENA